VSDEKKILLYTLPNCIHCEEAKPIVYELAQQHGLKVEEHSLTELLNDNETEELMAPTVCLIQKGKKEKCIKGISDSKSFRHELSSILQY